MKRLAIVLVVLAGCGDDAAQGPPVASVTVGPTVPPMVVGSVLALEAEVRGEDGAVLGREVTWRSSDAAVLAVGDDGVATAIAPGAVEVTAEAGGQEGTIALTVVDGVVTGIDDVRAFLQRCPANDPAYAEIRRDFELRADGVPISAEPACTEPYPMVPIAQLTDELYVLQALRIAYHLGTGTAGRLPWTSLSFYAWLHARVGGINLKSAPGQLYCCDSIDGKLFFAMSRQDAFGREFKRDWPGLSSTVAFFAHEIRHADPGAPGHVNGCPAFPQPTDPAGCDQTYDPANLGSYGIQYWLFAGWATGALHVGFRCAPGAEADAYVADQVQQAGGYLDRFVTGAPPAVTGRLTYGGPCP